MLRNSVSTKKKNIYKKCNVLNCISRTKYGAEREIYLFICFFFFEIKRKKQSQPKFKVKVNAFYQSQS